MRTTEPRRGPLERGTHDRFLDPCPQIPGVKQVADHIEKRVKDCMCVRISVSHHRLIMMSSITCTVATRTGPSGSTSSAPPCPTTATRSMTSRRMRTCRSGSRRTLHSCARSQNVTEGYRRLQKVGFLRSHRLIGRYLDWQVPRWRILDWHLIGT